MIGERRGPFADFYPLLVVNGWVNFRQFRDRRISSPQRVEAHFVAIKLENHADLPAPRPNAVERRKRADRRITSRRHIDLGPPPSIRQRRFRSDRRGARFLTYDNDF